MLLLVCTFLHLFAMERAFLEFRMCFTPLQQPQPPVPHARSATGWLPAAAATPLLLFVGKDGEPCGRGKWKAKEGTEEFRWNSRVGSVFRDSKGHQARRSAERRDGGRVTYQWRGRWAYGLHRILGPHTAEVDGEMMLCDRPRQTGRDDCPSKLGWIFVGECVSIMGWIRGRRMNKRGQNVRGKEVGRKRWEQRRKGTTNEPSRGASRRQEWTKSRRVTNTLVSFIIFWRTGILRPRHFLEASHRDVNVKSLIQWFKSLTVKASKVPFLPTIACFCFCSWSSPFCEAGNANNLSRCLLLSTHSHEARLLRVVLLDLLLDNICDVPFTAFEMVADDRHHLKRVFIPNKKSRVRDRAEQTHAVRKGRRRSNDPGDSGEDGDGDYKRAERA
ncbi:hypothetical protein C8R45DRAFT_944935 [Mycena sanguinolenta]|nr:hypothetical protein C8R45DRAFT_944935 [Mycena sanguinolenta]